MFGASSEDSAPVLSTAGCKTSRTPPRISVSPIVSARLLVDLMSLAIVSYGIWSSSARIRAELDQMPYETIANDIKSTKSRAETMGETLILGGVRDVLQPAVDKTGALSSELAPNIVGARYGLKVNLPLK